MLLAVLSGFLLAAAVPWLYKLLQGRINWALALLPAGLTVYFASFMPEIAAGDQVLVSYNWIPSLDIQLSFLLDGLSLMFALLISGIGTFILLYAGSYLHGDRDLPKFYIFILAFMASMLGLVLSNNLISLFVFWELTSITSYMLIGYHHEQLKSRKSALQGLLVTVGGGMALMAGLILMGSVAGTYEISEILNNGDVIRDSGLYTGILILILIGTFSKSAQVPLHFWLPNAMAAPTPVSAYLHSATMVKAGVYLLARLNPSLGETELWHTILPLFGALTMFTGMFLAYRSTEIKKILAYTTLMALGTLTMLIGIGTELAIGAAMTFLLAHALYKASLFLVAGSLDHSTGTKDITKMGGLARIMPITTYAAILAALSMAGIAPLFGFIAKEMLFEAVLESNYLTSFLLVLTVATAMLGVAIGGVIALRPFFGARKETPSKPHEAPFAMWIGPATLATLGLLCGLLPFLPERGILSAAVTSVYGEYESFYLTLWHGFNLPLMLSIASIAVGVLLFFGWDAIRARLLWLDKVFAYGPERGYEKALDGMNWTAQWQTRVLQNGYLRYYLLTILATLIGLVGYTLFTGYEPRLLFDFVGVQFIEAVIAILIVLAAVVAATTHSRLGAVVSVGVVGFGVALVYVLFSAPDLGITQVLVETLTVLLLVLVLFRLPEFLDLSSTAARMRDAVVAVAVGSLFTLLLLTATELQLHDPISQFFVENSEPEGHGRNIVNVILVDFRALDTLGEIFVLALAAIGVYAMIKFRAEEYKK
ncbi:Na(+)/H(+) antiporter subunit A [Alkalilimnicola ehrlichii]|uniref:Na(+)/H(+) antiporter subunit A n=1 Tax=Alkalilimnicola ehrlichii TaxID=351052 RepID=A0A3E0X192_9GAMM|nr:putative monovalent cation/H+ antiporter subunit A [Alkalilimnicola ehrlichii]RFA30365.1 Na(+)/H(+) antiporter subunit A [Alkalilimnicola ehrlichii]RFA37937.1 Na(+)/H(+) antiporter subunit A [Alkalilimnicola ehrlichii]